MTKFINALIHEYDKKYSPKFSTALDVYNEMKEFVNLSKEVLVVFYLDTKNKIIAREVVTIGILNSSLVHPREIFRHAIINNCCSIIISHNHTTGDTTPTPEDRDIFRQLIEAGKILGIKVLDHIVVGENSYYSCVNGDGL